MKKQSQFTQRTDVLDTDKMPGRRVGVPLNEANSEWSMAALKAYFGGLTPEQLQLLQQDIAAARARASHTGTQAISTVDGLQLALDGKAPASHTHTSASILDFQEAVQDAVAAFMQSGGGVTLTYDDAANTYTITSSPGETFDPEKTRDAIGAALVPLGLIDIALNDAADTISISTRATQNAPDAQLRARATHTGTQLASTVSDFAPVAAAAARADLENRPSVLIGGETTANGGVFIWDAGAQDYHHLRSIPGGLYLHATGAGNGTAVLLGSGRLALLDGAALRLFSEGGTETVDLMASEAGELLVNGQPLANMGFAPLTAAELNADKQDWAGLGLRASLLRLINEGAGSGTGGDGGTVTPPADPPAAAPTNLAVDPGRNATFTPAAGTTAADYEYQFS